MNVKRLELMATMLTEVVLDQWQPDQNAMMVEMRAPYTKPKFNLDYWGAAKSCGYTACACGHAGLDPRFIDQGLTIRNNTVYFEGYRDWAAVREFFDITASTSNLLFMPDFRHKTESDVIRRIIRLIELGEEDFVDECEQ